MSCIIGRASLTTNPYNLSLNGRMLSFSVDLVGATVVELTALRQQLCGVVGNVDEETIPFTWSEDATLDGFYTNANVTVPSTINMLNSFFVQSVQVTLEQVTGFSNPWFEVTTNSLLRTNVHGYTVPPAVIATAAAAAVDEVDLRPSLLTATRIDRPTSTGVTVSAYTLASPVTLTQYRAVQTPALFYTGACTVELLSGSTWSIAVGRGVPLTRVWRISNGIIRLTSKNGATEGKLEIWDNGAGAWESASIQHTDAGTLYAGIGGSTTTTNASLSILRNTPEQVVVKVSGYSAAVLSNFDFTYSIQRGAHHVVASWTANSTRQLGIGFTTTIACSAVGTGSCGISNTANDANGNRLVFAFPVAITSDLVNGRLYPNAAATSGQMLIGVVLAGGSAASGNAATDIINQFMGAVAWAQKIVVR